MNRKNIHDPDANLDRTFDWSDWLTAGDTITTATVTSDTVAISDVTWDDTTVTCWVSGGTAGTHARVTCRVTTVAGRVDDRTVTLYVIDR